MPRRGVLANAQQDLAGIERCYDERVPRETERYLTRSPIVRDRAPEAASRVAALERCTLRPDPAWVPGRDCRRD